CECLLPAQPGYPWTLSLRTTWELSDAGLSAAHWVTNLADAPAPFGFSVHPYLQLPGVPVADLRLRVPAKSRLLTDSRLLPIGAAKIEGTEWDFTSPRRIGDLVMDTAFGSGVPESDGGSAVTVTAPDGTGLRLWADASFRWWQVFTGDTLPCERRRRSVAAVLSALGRRPSGGGRGRRGGRHWRRWRRFPAGAGGQARRGRPGRAEHRPGDRELSVERGLAGAAGLHGGWCRCGGG